MGGDLDRSEEIRRANKENPPPRPACGESAARRLLRLISNPKCILPSRHEQYQMHLTPVVGARFSEAVEPPLGKIYRHTSTITHVLHMGVC